MEFYGTSVAIYTLDYFYDFSIIVIFLIIAFVIGVIGIDIYEAISEQKKKLRYVKENIHKEK